MTGNSSSTTDSMNIISLPQETVENEGLLLALSSALPWAISTVLHIGLFLILFFMVATLGRPPIVGDPLLPAVSFVAPVQPKQDQTVKPSVIDPIKEMEKRGYEEKGGSALDEGLGEDIYKGLNQDRNDKNGLANLLTTGEHQILGIGPGCNGKSGKGGTTGEWGLVTDRPKTIFPAAVGNVVFVIDRSGSMIETLDFVKTEMLRTIGSMKANFGFHTIFFSTGAPIENPAKKLIPANPDNKKQVADFLNEVTAEGLTNPIKAMERAFQVLEADKTDKPQIIYLLTDGEFPSDAVAKIRAMNANHRVRINTICFLSEAGRAQLQRIADENGGKCKVITRDQLGGEK